MHELNNPNNVLLPDQKNAMKEMKLYIQNDWQIKKLTQETDYVESLLKYNGDDKADI